VIFSIVSIALFMSSVDSTIVATALPTLRHALSTRLNWAAWTISAYQLGLVVSMPLMGRISDQFGRKRIFLIAAVVFTTASLACGCAQNIGELIALRVVQALGAGAFLPSASGIIAETFGEGRDRAIGLMSGVFPFGALAGPIFGGLIIATFSWREIFFVNVPIGIGFALLALRYLPHTTPPGGHADIRGGLYLGASVLALMLAVTKLGYRHTSVSSLGFLVPLAVSIAIAFSFVHRAGRVEDALIPARLLKGRAFILMNLINVIWGACVLGVASLVPLLAESRYGFSPLSAGSLLTTRALLEMAIAVVAAMTLSRTGYRVPMTIGFAFIIAGLALLAIRAPVSPYAWLVIATGLTGIGTGTSAPATNNATLNLAPADIGAISGLRGASRQIGGILGVGITTSFASRSAHEATALSHSLLGMAGLLTLMLPVIYLAVPRGSGLVARERFLSE